MHFFNTLAVDLVITLTATTAHKICHCTQSNTIALTFDDGPYQYTAELLDQLKTAGIKATFFINGYNWWKDLERDPEKRAVIKRTMEEGHQVASHTWAHQIPEGENEIKEALVKLDDLVEGIAGVRPRYFRAPQGHCEEDCMKLIEDLGYKIVQWDTDTEDWNYFEFEGLTKEEGREKRVGMVKEFLTEEWSKAKENYLVLMHDVHIHTVREIVPWLLENAPFDKYRFVTVAECLGDASGAYRRGNHSNSTVSFLPGKVTTTFHGSANTTVPGGESDHNNLNVKKSDAYHHYHQQIQHISFLTLEVILFNMVVYMLF
ncbi:glycoside hydrolase/deacetylase [Neocallimastix lanati (nom. inval.)]|nr:glycoside hydrolase/deacetylase [Neocallimastix sp. JGI-2020a]